MGSGNMPIKIPESLIQEELEKLLRRRPELGVALLGSPQIKAEEQRRVVEMFPELMRRYFERFQPAGAVGIIERNVAAAMTPERIIEEMERSTEIGERLKRSYVAAVLEAWARGLL
ncbi:MAG: hypothetical protein ACXQS1_05865 [Methermicoccaceae archaeon]